jgi:NitT/TauT family transport system ATP-binding protein
VRPVYEVVVPKVALDAISLSYKTTSGERLLALDNISLEVKPGEFLCIVGAFGMRQVDAAAPDCRAASADLGKGAGGWEAGEWAGNRSHPDLSGTRIVSLADGRRECRVRHEDEERPKAEREEKVQYYLRLVHLSKFRDSYIHQLSGGMRQRVALARALATEPDVLLMDEPFAALDAQTRDLLHDELERIWAETGCTIIFVTHNVREAARLGDRVVLLTFRPGTREAGIFA